SEVNQFIALPPLCWPPICPSRSRTNLAVECAHLSAIFLSGNRSRHRVGNSLKRAVVVFEPTARASDSADPPPRIRAELIEQSCEVVTRSQPSSRRARSFTYTRDHANPAASLHDRDCLHLHQQSIHGERRDADEGRGGESPSIGKELRARLTHR